MADTIRFRCPSCLVVINVRSVYAGREADCPNCKAAIRIPAGWRVWPWLLLAALLAGAAVWGVVNWQKWGSMPPVSWPDEAALCARVAAHPWWKEKPSLTDARRIGQAVVEAGGSDAVWIDDHGKVVVVKKPEGFIERYSRPEGIGKRNLLFNMQNRFGERPSLRRVLEEIASDLDFKHYRDD